MDGYEHYTFIYFKDDKNTLKIVMIIVLNGYVMEAVKRCRVGACRDKI